MRIGIDLDNAAISGLVIDTDQRLIAERRVGTAGSDYAATLAALAALVRDLEADAAAQELPVGLALPGLVHARTQQCSSSHLRLLAGRPLVRDLSATLGRPVRSANTADCLALSESFDGAAVDASSVFALTLGEGVGGGLMVNGALLSGRNGLAGQWGHNSLPWPRPVEVRTPPRCWCGLDGCIEAWLSAPGMSADHLRRGGHALTALEIVTRAEGGERLAGATLREWLERLARALAMVINIVDPEVIVVGGPLASIRWLYSEIPKIWHKHALAEQLSTRLLPARHGTISPARAAARLWPESAATHG